MHSHCMSVKMARSIAGMSHDFFGMFLFCFVCIYFLKVPVTIIGIPFVRKILKYFRKKEDKKPKAIFRKNIWMFGYGL